MELDELGIDIEAQNCLDQIQQESQTSADYDPSQGMTGEELHNFCKFLYSQIQSKDEEIWTLTIFRRMVICICCGIAVFGMNESLG